MLKGSGSAVFLGRQP